MDDSRRSTEKLLALMERSGKTFADLEAAGVVRPAQLRLLENGRFGGLRTTTLIELSDFLGCGVADVVAAIERD
ncbi:helix-turn-helix domain-containing protein [Arabiibacter massiliensis]|uniref:helix-turn-helix domain-containing protein n=1 Tax=Arabiibacter massiliensis TaxID=1870985 RepID=UPI0009BC708A|nr:helix-turn-helix transcriptional regulator [Arabiibacter massiliensis]